MSGPAPTRVVIAGGGTAGWIAAAAIATQLGPLVSVTLVESEEIGTVGVGEATIPTARTFHKLIGIDERAFMAATGATFKLGIAFENWGAVGERYIHAFGTLGQSTWMADFHHLWLEADARGLAEPLPHYCFEGQAAEEGRFATSDTSTISYAYHLDAGLYARFLRAMAEGAGVTRHEGRIAEVRLDEADGRIAALALADGRVLEGDLFIDCTGFRALLIEGALKAGWEDWAHWLPTDSALAVQTQATGPALPYTQAIAHADGWRWRIPLQHRVGNGLVYAGAFLGDEAARERLLSALDGPAITEPRLIRYRTGRRRQAWRRNCIALGLSSGFVEPLESTSIHLIMIGVTRLIQLFPFADGADEALSRRYNAMADAELERVRDFIILHYHLTRRDDAPLWRHCRSMPIPDTLAERLDLFAEAGGAYRSADDLFQLASWVQVMAGQGLRPRRWHRMGALMSDAQLGRALADMRANIAGAVARLPAHQAFLDRYLAQPARRAG